MIDLYPSLANAAPRDELDQSNSAVPLSRDYVVHETGDFAPPPFDGYAFVRFEA
jgi:hypothetical protein